MADKITDAAPRPDPRLLGPAVDGTVRAPIGDATALPARADALALVRRFEPALHFTAGEMFFPMTVDDYLRHASLWSFNPRDPEGATLIVDRGDLDATRLAAAAQARPDSELFMRYALRPLHRNELRAWRKGPNRPKFHGISRMAAVGLLGRVIDAVMRLSLLIRGKVPGGLVAAAQQQYDTLHPHRHAYHAHVSTDGGYVIIQYWFLYAMNDWRSSFSGVNDHEADWEQVTIYLAPSDGQRGHDYKVAWVAFSSHDETGDDLRRRHDDPDIGWIDGTHPIVYPGAGSHSGAYLAGDYLVRVQPPALTRSFAVFTAIRGLLLPWTRDRPVNSLGIPYVDYRRGDGERIGPGTDRPWTPILIDSATPWVRDFRGLWGLDTTDPFGGERAPAGPRYERDGTIRPSWADPVGWAGLDKVPPTAAATERAQTARIAELDERINDLTAQIDAAQVQLRQQSTGVTALPTTASRHDSDSAASQLAAGEERTAALRARRREATNERDQLQHVAARTLHPGPHAHLRHRAVPDPATPTNVLLRFWTGASLSILLAVLGLALLHELGPVWQVTIGALLVVKGVEATLRGRLGLFLLGLLSIASAVVLTWMLFTHLRLALGILALIAAATLAIANLRNLLNRRWLALPRAHRWAADLHLWRSL